VTHKTVVPDNSGDVPRTPAWVACSVAMLLDGDKEAYALLKPMMVVDM